jgi:hypothetical protein
MLVTSEGKVRESYSFHRWIEDIKGRKAI